MNSDQQASELAKTYEEPAKPLAGTTDALPKEFNLGDSVRLQNEGEFTPAHEGLLIRMAKPGEVRSKGGIILTQQSDDGIARGEILSAGPGRVAADTGVLCPVSHYVGQIIIFRRFDAQPLRVNGENLVLLSDTKVLGSIEGA